MRNKLFFYLMTGILSVSILGCEKDDNNLNTDGKVELYLIDSFSTIDNSYQIDESSVITSSSPLIKYSDFISYNSTEYSFEISNEAKNSVTNLEYSGSGVPFAIMANDTLIYTGYFWSSYSSTGCDWIVIDTLMVNNANTIKVQLGYPGLIQGVVIPDKRNDNRIIRIFERDNKLR